MIWNRFNRNLIEWDESWSRVAQITNFRSVLLRVVFVYKFDEVIMRWITFNPWHPANKLTGSLTTNRSIHCIDCFCHCFMKTFDDVRDLNKSFSITWPSLFFGDWPFVTVQFVLIFDFSDNLIEIIFYGIEQWFFSSWKKVSISRDLEQHLTLTVVSSDFIGNWTQPIGDKTVKTTNVQFF